MKRAREENDDGGNSSKKRQLTPTRLTKKVNLRLDRLEDLRSTADAAMAMRARLAYNKTVSTAIDYSDLLEAERARKADGVKTVNESVDSGKKIAQSKQPLKWHSKIHKLEPAPKPVTSSYHLRKSEDFPNAGKEPEKEPEVPEDVIMSDAAQDPAPPVEETVSYRNFTNAEAVIPVPPKKEDDRTFHRWGDLPAELQLKVLRYVLTIGQPVTKLLHGTFCLTNRAPVTCTAQTCKAMRDVVIPMYYSGNLFIIGRVGRAGSAITGTSDDIWTYPNPAVARFVRYLEVKVRIPPSGSRDLSRMMASSSDWRYMLRPNDAVSVQKDFGKFLHSYGEENTRADWTKSCSRWQDYFPRVRELQVSLLSWCKSETLCLHDWRESTFYDLAGAVKDATIVIRSKSVKVTAAEEDERHKGKGYCWAWCKSDHGETGRETCADIITSTVAGMIKLRGDDEEAEDENAFPAIEFQRGEASKSEYKPLPPRSKVVLVPGKGWVYEEGAPKNQDLEDKNERIRLAAQRKQKEEAEAAAAAAAAELAARPPKKRKGHRGGAKKRRKGKKKHNQLLTMQGVMNARVQKAKKRRKGKKKHNQLLTMQGVMNARVQKAKKKEPLTLTSFATRSRVRKHLGMPSLDPKPKKRNRK